MSFCQMLEILQQKNKEKIVLIKLGTFYIATGRDAVLLNRKLQLKVTCLKNNICKVGIPVNSLEKYIEKLDKIKYSYIVYDYDKQKNELKEIYNKEGKKNKITEDNKNCILCKGIDAYKTDPYMTALTNLFEKEKMSEVINNKIDINKKDINKKQLLLIPKIEDYLEYMINVIIKLPRTEKFNIGNEYKTSMYNMMKNTLYINKLNRKENSKETLKSLNIIDTELNCQRVYLRIMKKQKWIDEKKFEVSMNKIYEIGKIIGGLEKIYAKNN